MTSRKRNLDKVERIANASTMDAPRWERGEVAAHLRELLAKAERGEIPRATPTPDEAKSEGRREFEELVARVANRIRYRVEGNGGEATGTQRPDHAQDEARTTGADDEPPEELLAKLLKKVGLASDKVH